ncbi:hypothetical protein [Streptomyces sp. NBC_01187]|uniref:hypothetical protein n=1 Tax=Streptomyces sp. NBC_01187 TaxID=2903766 RepID=UPI003870A486|nr:hypothetical protein OG220_39940 [Streptomyces sp. NBC_01187]WSS47027.1 hypothetical protein OG220_41685 [Streptomyces sp. NBC_01187]
MGRDGSRPALSWESATTGERQLRNRWIAGVSVGLAVILGATGCGSVHGKKAGKKTARASKSARAEAHKSHRQGKFHKPHKPRVRHKSPVAAPLSVAEARNALLNVDDLPAGGTVDEEHLDGQYHVQQNLFGMKAKSASCRSFIDRTNRAIGKPRLAVERTLKESSTGDVTARVVDYRSPEAAERAMSQLRNVSGECPAGVTKDGAKVTFARWSTARAGDETVGNKMSVFGMPFGDVLVRVGAATVELNFSKSDDAALISQLTNKAADHLRSAAR